MSKVATLPPVPKNRVLASKEATLFKTVLVSTYELSSDQQARSHLLTATVRVAPMETRREDSGPDLEEAPRAWW